MKIGFDLDRIFINTPPVIPRTIIEHLYRDRGNSNPHYRIPGLLEQKIRQLSHLPIFRQSISDNLQFLNELSKNKYYTLFLISSRFGFLKKQTETLARKYNFYAIFKKIYFNFDNKQPHVFKNETLNGLNLDRYVDDDLSLLKFLDKHQQNTKFFWLNSKHSGKVQGNIRGVKDIREIIA